MTNINPLLDVMSEIDDNIITNTATTAKKGKKHPVMMIAAAAAAATLLTGAGVAAVVQKIDYKSGFYIGEEDGVELPYKALENVSFPSYEELTEMYPSLVTSYFNRDEWHDDYDVGLTTVPPSEFARMYNIPLLINDNFTEEAWTNLSVNNFEGKLSHGFIKYALINKTGGERTLIIASFFNNDNIQVSAGSVDPETDVYEKVTLNDGSEGVIYKRNPYGKNCDTAFVRDGMIYSVLAETDIDGMKRILSDLGVL